VRLFCAGAKVVGGVIAAPVVVGLAASAAAIALPAYGTYRLAKTVRKKLEEADIGLVAY
jgi:Tfp pilus assembly major pilin PilA